MTTTSSLPRTKPGAPKHGTWRWPLKRLPTGTDPYLRLNGLSPYYTMFPLEFPFRKLASARPGEWVLDPFCGRGTTNFAARLRGLRSVGVDANIVAAAIASAKTKRVRPESVIGLCSRALECTDLPFDVPEGEFWQLCYSKNTLHQLCKVREHLLKCKNTSVSAVLRALLLGILHGPRHKTVDSYLSNQMPRTYATKLESAIRYWRKQSFRPPKVDLLELVKRRAYFSLDRMPPAPPGKVLLGDSRKKHLPKTVGPFRWVITSPPYPGMRTYKPDQWLRNWFLGGPPHVDYETAGQIITSEAEQYIEDLAEVWRKITPRCVDGARLVVRAGCLPSIPLSASELVCRSIRNADCGWRVLRTLRAGTACRGNRQAGQFGVMLGQATEESDVLAALEK